MKKILLILFLTLAVAVMAACDSGPGDTSTVTSEPASTVSETTSRAETVNAATGYIFTANGVSFGVGDLSEQIVEKLGRPSADDVVTTDSCAFGGKDTVYYYPSFEISANDETGEFVIYCIYLKDDTVSTQEGAYVGMAPAEVKDIYGDPAEETEGGIIYYKDRMKLSFILKDGAVAAISYYVNN